jgi:hypothetical protein
MIRCDGPSCGSFFVAYEPSSVGALRRRGQSSEGWVVAERRIRSADYVDKWDYCPDHAALAHAERLL